MESTKLLNHALKNIIHTYNYPCFHREINKILRGKHEKGIRKTFTKDENEKLNLLQEKIITQINSGYTEDDVMNYLKILYGYTKRNKSIEQIV